MTCPNYAVVDWSSLRHVIVTQNVQQKVTRCLDSYGTVLHVRTGRLIYTLISISNLGSITRVGEKMNIYFYILVSEHFHVIHLDQVAVVVQQKAKVEVMAVGLLHKVAELLRPVAEAHQREVSDEPVPSTDMLIRTVSCLTVEFNPKTLNRNR